jgi:hypothetical protein
MQRYNQSVVSIDKDKKEVTLSSGAKLAYNSLLSTLPLDIVSGACWADVPGPCLSLVSQTPLMQYQLQEGVAGSRPP